MRGIQHFFVKNQKNRSWSKLQVGSAVHSLHYSSFVYNFNTFLTKFTCYSLLFSPRDNSTMDANKTCKIVLKYVKKSNLNWSLTESPFSVTINVKKSFIKDQHGVFRTSEIVNHEEHVKFLDSTIREQKQTIEEYQHEVHELSMQLQKAKKEISDVMLEKQHIVNAGEVIEGLLVNKNSEIVQLKG